MEVVLLGFIDLPISDPSAVSWDTNKIGGSPVSSCTAHLCILLDMLCSCYLNIHVYVYFLRSASYF